MPRRFYESAGPIGLIPGARVPYRRIVPVANPYVNLIAGISHDSVGRPINPMGGKVMPPRTATATIAGRAHVGCCGECAADYRRA